MESVKEILAFKRNKDVWVCPDCDIENDDVRRNCLFCGREKTGKEWKIKKWDPDVKYKKEVVVDKKTPKVVNTELVERRIMVDDYEEPEEKNNYLIGIIIGACILFIILSIPILRSLGVF